MPPWKRNVGMVFQSYALWPHMTVGENVAFGLEERRLPRATVREEGRAGAGTGGAHRVRRAAARPALGGQQQRVALARTLCDRAARAVARRAAVEPRREAAPPHAARLVAMQKQLAITTIFVTHDQEGGDDDRRPDRGDAPGRDPAGGRAHRALRRRSTASSPEFVGTINLVPGEAAGGAVASSLGTVGLPAGSVGRTGAWRSRSGRTASR